VEGENITDPQTIAETCNGYFVAIAENVKKQRNNNFIDDDNDSVDNHTLFMEQAFNTPYPSMDSKYTSAKEIEGIIKSLKAKNSYGYKEISTKVLKLSGPFISSPVEFICNKMFSEGVFPDRLKYAIIKPLHKKCKYYFYLATESTRSCICFRLDLYMSHGLVMPLCVLSKNCFLNSASACWFGF